MAEESNQPMFRQRRPQTTLAVLPLLLLSALPASARDSASVSVAPLSEIAIYPQKTAPATVISLNETALSTEIGARIESIPARVGEVVEKGALLAELDCTDYILSRDETDAQVAALDARLELAEKRLQRVEKLARQQTVAEEMLDQRASELAALRADRRAAAARLQRARADVGRCKLLSPLHAVITRRIAAEGEFADRGTPVLELVDRERLEIAAQVPAGDVKRLQSISKTAAKTSEATAEATPSPSFPRKRESRNTARAATEIKLQPPAKTAATLFFEDSAGRYPLLLRTVVPTINPTTRNREVRLVFAAGAALPGAGGKLVWRDNRPHVSGKLLLRRAGQLGVFLYADGKARFHRLAEAQQGRASAVDLPLNTRVITQGQFNLRDGQAVTPSP